MPVVITLTWPQHNTPALDDNAYSVINANALRHDQASAEVIAAPQPA